MLLAVALGAEERVEGMEDRDGEEGEERERDWTEGERRGRVI